MEDKPYLYKRNAENIIYYIQTKLQTHLPDEVRHDIYTQVLAAVMNESKHSLLQAEGWKSSYYELKQKRFPLKWNELRIKMARLEEITPDEVLQYMIRLDEDEYIS